MTEFLFFYVWVNLSFNKLLPFEWMASLWRSPSQIQEAQTKLCTVRDRKENASKFTFILYFQESGPVIVAIEGL